MISRQNLDVVQAHFTGNVCIDLMTFKPLVSNSNNKMGIRKSLNDNSSGSNVFLLRQAQKGLPNTKPKELRRLTTTREDDILGNLRLYLTKIEIIESLGTLPSR